MILNFEIETLNNIQKIKLLGRLDSNTSNLIEKSILNLFDINNQYVLIDFTSLNYISSAGIRVIIMSAKKAKKQNGRLILFNLSTDVRSVFEISGLLTILEIAENYDSALTLLK